jgi:hypothetical protein
VDYKPDWDKPDWGVDYKWIGNWIQIRKQNRLTGPLTKYDKNNELSARIACKAV